MSVDRRPVTAPAALQAAATTYEGDEFAKGDGVLLFAMMDRDVSGYLDTREMVKAKELMLSAFVGTMENDMIYGLLNHSDDNNDGKVNEIEWHDFLRSIYEVIGRKKFLAGLRTWKHTIYEQLDQEKKEQEEKKKEAGAKKKSNKNKSMSKDEAATKIQARFRGNKGRKEVAKKKAKKNRGGVHDPEEVEMARQAGRHLITVISEDQNSGTRADFYFDGDEIDFTKSDGDFGHGVQVVVICPDARKVPGVLWKSCYDVTGHNRRDECRRLASEIGALEDGTFVLLAVKGSGLKDLDQKSIAALHGLGAKYAGLGKEDVGYALIGCKGYHASAERHGGKAEAEAAVSFSKELHGEKLEE